MLPLHLQEPQEADPRGQPPALKVPRPRDAFEFEGIFPRFPMSAEIGDEPGEKVRDMVKENGKEKRVRS